MTQLEHGRQFIRSLHYNLLGHDSLDFYWTGQAMLNYPINEFELMTDFDEFLGHLIDYFGGLGQYAYGIVDQNALNHTKQHLYL